MFGLDAVRGGDHHLARTGQPASAFQPVDLVLAEQELHAFGQGRDALGLLFHHLRQVELWRDLDAQAREAVVGLLEQL